MNDMEHPRTHETNHRHQPPKWTQTEKSMESKSGGEGSQCSLLQKLINLSKHHFCFFYVCDGTQSCWNVIGLPLKCFLASWSGGVKINSMYEFVLTFAPWGTNMRGDFHVFDMADQTMTKEGFWLLKIRHTDVAGMQSFCRLQITSTLNNFSSEKNEFSCIRTIFHFLEKNLRSNQYFFSFWTSVRCWEVRNSRVDNFNSV